MATVAGGSGGRRRHLKQSVNTYNLLTAARKEGKGCCSTSISPNHREKTINEGILTGKKEGSREQASQQSPVQEKSKARKPPVSYLGQQQSTEGEAVLPEELAIAGVVWSGLKWPTVATAP